MREQNAFLRTALHDMRNSLTLIIGYVQYLKKNYAGVLDELALGFLDDADDSGLKLTRITNAVSQVLYIQDHGLNRVPLDMGQIVGTVCKRLDPIIVERGAQLEIPTEWPHVLGEARFIETVWFNLFSNALIYGGQSPHITLSTTPLAHTDPKLIRFSMRDQGPGLSAEGRTLMFTPFPRLSPERSEALGLGLYVARKIVESAGGSVGVETEPGHGATFSFSLPAAD